MTTLYRLESNKEEGNKEERLRRIKNHVHKNMHLEKTINAWKSATNFLGKIHVTTEEHAAEREQLLAAKAEELKISKKEEEEYGDCIEIKIPKGKKRGHDPSKSKESDVLRYRVTCERSGKHAFESKDVAMVVGGELQDKYHWVVDLSTYHLEVVCKLRNGMQQIINDKIEDFLKIKCTNKKFCPPEFLR